MTKVDKYQLFKEKSTESSKHRFEHFANKKRFSTHRIVFCPPNVDGI